MNSQASNDRSALKQIAAMLLGLANLAERASVRSRPILFLVLWLLRPAEAYARDLVFRISCDIGAQGHLPVDILNDLASMPITARTDALRLAVSFTMLAAALDSLAELAFVREQALSPDCRQYLRLFRFADAVQRGSCDLRNVDGRHALVLYALARRDTS